MKSPRIYTYKVTFEEVPYWYWGVHKEKKFGELYLGTPITHAWMWEFYTPYLQICEEFPYTDEGWITANKVEDRMIFPDLNNPLCLNESCGARVSLNILRQNGGKVVKRLHQEKTDERKSKHALKMANAAHAPKTSGGKSQLGVSNGKRLHEVKDEKGRSINSVKGSEKLNQEKDENGKSVKALKGLKTLHSEKTEDGKSAHAVKCFENVHVKKDENGKSVLAVRAGKEAAKKLNSQLYKCLITGKVSTAAGLSHWQLRRGIDTSLREKLP